MKRPRREFLARCWQSLGLVAWPGTRQAGAAKLPHAFARLSAAQDTAAQAAAQPPEFHFHPHYREQAALNATLLQRKAGGDEFALETTHDAIAAKLAAWTAEMQGAPPGFAAIEKSLSAGFRGGSLLPASFETAREGGGLSVKRARFGEAAERDAAAFVADLRASLTGLAGIETAEFQITRIREAGPGPDAVTTTVRYELVARGAGFHREQRVGKWEMAWERAADGWRVRAWRALEEERSRAAEPVFADRTEAVMGRATSYREQLSRGVDYWRTVLDGACGIDLYGHNGVSLGDIDGDGFDDLYVCQPAGLPNRLYRNRGDGTFEDITEASGMGVLENTACALIADFDNDGREDIVVVRANGPLLFRNQGRGKFRLQPDAFQFASPPQGTFVGAAAADYDRDGRLDIYFCLYVYYQGTDQYKYPVPYYDAQNGPPNFLMRNNGDGTFRDVTAQTALDRNNNRYSFCCGWGDHNGDGWPDLYVVNDFGRKNLYRNNGDGTFTDIAVEAGVEDTGAGMSVCWFDDDNDGRGDLYVADMWTAAGERISMQDVFQKDAPQQTRAFYQKHAMGNSLFRNKGKSVYQDATHAAGLGIGRWAWSSDAWDFDHDGFPDLYIANGMISGPLTEDLNSFFWRQVVARSPGEAKASPDYEHGWHAINELIRADYSWSGYERNVFYANNRDGTFANVSGAVGLDFAEDARSFAIGDIDHDGRQEVFLKNRNAPQLRVLKNVMRELPYAIAFRLRGTRSHGDAIGAAVTIETAAGKQTKWVQAGSGFLAQHSKEVFFGLGEAKGPVKATIRWPSGIVQTLENLPPDQRILVEESERLGDGAWRGEPFRQAADLRGTPHTPAEPNEEQRLPEVAETWLLAPVAAPDFGFDDAAGAKSTLAGLQGKAVLLRLGTNTSAESRRDQARIEQRHAAWASRGLHLLCIDVGSETPAGYPQLHAPADVAAVYNLLYRYLFERHRDLALPTSFLIDERGMVVKIYQGAVAAERVEADFGRLPRTQAERLQRALPFPGEAGTYAFGRNQLSYGSVFYQHGYFDQAEQAFRLAAADDASSAEARYGLGSVFLKRGNTAGAKAEFERAVTMKASYPETLPNAWNNLGLLATREGKLDIAIEHFQQALRVSPEHWIALENLGNAYRQEKRWDEARQMLERALASRPQEAEANYSLAMVYAQTEQPERAHGYFEKALHYRPVYPEALNNLGILYLRTGKRDAAVARFEECIRVAPEFDQAYFNLARVYYVEGAKEKARGVLGDLLKQQPANAAAKRTLEQLQ